MDLATLRMGMDAALVQLKGDSSPWAHADPPLSGAAITMDPSPSSPRAASGYDDAHGLKSSVMQSLAHLHAIPHLKLRLKVTGGAALLDSAIYWVTRLGMYTLKSLTKSAALLPCAGDGICSQGFSI